jgi:hypothetical protein
MQAYHSESVVKDGKVVVTGVPFESGEKVEVLVRPATANDETAWERAAAEDFLKGYSEEDSAYDHYDEWKNTGSAIS